MPTLRFKLILSYVLIILLSFSFIAYFLDKNLEKNSLQEIKFSLVHQASLIEAQIPLERLQNQDRVFLDELIKALARRIQGRITIIDSSGVVLVDSEKSLKDVSGMENHAYRLEVASALKGETGEEIRYSTTLKIDMLYVALPVRSSQGIVAVVRLALPLTQIQKELSSVRKTIAMNLALAIGLAFLLGFFFSVGITKPINKISRGARRFSAGDFSHKILLDSKDEMGALASTLNKMAQALEDKILEIQLQNQHLKAILQSMAEGIIVVDKESKIISVNASAERIFNIHKEDSHNKLFLEAIPNNDIADLIRKALTKGEFVAKELSLVWPVHKIFKIDVSPVFERDTISGCLVVVHDVTEIRRLETMRKDFVANVSHELRTPLTSIKGFVETLLEGALEDKENARHFLTIIHSHANRLNSLIDDLLSLSHLESQRVVLEKNEIETKVLVDHILSGFKTQLEKKSINAMNDISAGFVIKGDKDKLSQVFTNFIDNAVKFNKEKGFIRIYSQEAEGQVKIIIEDSGIGIPQKDLSRIFERFYRVDKARSRELGGTGLGLSIVKHIIELHGGTVGVESVEDNGSKFFFSLPR